MEGFDCWVERGTRRQPGEGFSSSLARVPWAHFIGIRHLSRRSSTEASQRDDQEASASGVKEQRALPGCRWSTDSRPGSCYVGLSSLDDSASWFQPQRSCLQVTTVAFNALSLRPSGFKLDLDRLRTCVNFVFGSLVELRSGRLVFR